MLNDERPAGRRYQDEVPAVARAVRLLGHLADTREPSSLADLARDLGVGPSSLLAILTTLRHAGLVARDRDGHYQVGPGLAALGQAAAFKLRACERFAAIADDLVAKLGETVLLWVRQDDALVLAAAREGVQPLRYVPSPGQRLSLGQTRLAILTDPTATLDGEAVLVVEEEYLPGIWTVAAALPTASDERACVALAGPRERIATPAARAALLAATSPAIPGAAREPTTSNTSPPLHRDAVGIQGPHGGMDVGTQGPHGGMDVGMQGPQGGTTEGAGAWGHSRVTAHSGPIEGAELDTFLGQSLVATLSYLAEDGYPATVPLWYAWDGTSFWLASRPGSEWAEHVRLDPRVSLAVSESTPPLRRVLARGLLSEVDDPGGTRWAEIEAQLAARYAGFDAAREPATAGRGRLLELRPERLIAWRGLLRHPKLPPDPDTPDSTSSTSSTPWRHLG